MKTNTANAIRCYIPLSSFLENELNRLASMQLSNGALPMWPLLPGHSGRICPYFSSFAALALLAGSSRYYENVRRISSGILHISIPPGPTAIVWTVPFTTTRFRNPTVF